MSEWVSEWKENAVLNIHIYKWMLGVSAGDGWLVGWLVGRCFLALLTVLVKIMNEWNAWMLNNSGGVCK